VAVDKINGFRAPYTSATFRSIADAQAGRNGLLEMDGSVTNTLLNVTVPPFTVIQQGLIYSKSVSTTVAIPTMEAPYYVVVSSPTPGQIDNLVFSYAKGPSDVTDTEVLLASYDGFEWQRAPIISIDGVIKDRYLENIVTGRVGPYSGLRTSVDGPDYRTTSGTLIDKTGQKQVFTEDALNPVVDADADWRRVDRIVYRRPSDSDKRIGYRKFLLGGTYAVPPVAKDITGLFTGGFSFHKTKTLITSDNAAHVLCVVSTGYAFELVYSKVSSDRAVISIPEITAISSLTDEYFDAIVDKNDYIHIVYSSGGNIYYQKMSSSGVLVGSAFVVDTQTGTCSRPRIGIDAGSFRLYIVYQSVVGVLDQIFFTVRDIATSAQAVPPKRITETVTPLNNLMNPDIFVDEDYVVHVVWENSSATSIQYQTFDDIGNSTNAVQTITTSVAYGLGTLSNGASNPRVVVSDNFDLFVAFLQDKGVGSGIGVWDGTSAVMRDFFVSTESFEYFDIHVEPVFNGMSFLLGRSDVPSVDIVKLQDGLASFSLTLASDMAYGLSFARDQLGSFYASWSELGGGYGGKSPSQSADMAYSYTELDGDILLARMLQDPALSGPVVLNWAKGGRPGSFFDFLAAYGTAVTIGWEETIPNTLTLGVGPGSSDLKIVDLFTDTNYTVVSGSYEILGGEALFARLNGTDLVVVPESLPIALLPWDEDIAVLGMNKDGEFNPILLGIAGMEQLDSGESIIFGEDLPQSIRARLGIISETAYQAYSSVLAINVSDTYPQALSSLDIMAAQNRHARLVRFNADWGVIAPNTLRVLSNCYVQIPGLAEARNTIAAQNILLNADGQIAYVSLNRTAGASANLAVTVAQASTVTPTRNLFVLARRTGTNIEVDGQAVTYADRLISGQINNIVQEGGTLEQAVKRLDVREDVVKRVRVITRTLSSLPVGVYCTIDAAVLANGDKVLFAHTSLNGIYQISGVGTSIAWTKLYEFAGSETPTSKSCVLVTDGGEINRTLWSYDLVKGWYRLSTLEDFVEVRVADFTTAILPSGAGPLVVDGETIVEGELVLFGNAALNRAYRVTGIGTAMEFEAVNVFGGLVTPSDGSLVLAQDGTVSDMMWEYDEETLGWVYLTLTTQNKTYLGLNSPAKAGGEYEDKLAMNQLNNIVYEADSIETAIKRLDVRPDVLKRVRVIDLSTAILPFGTSVVIDGVTLSNGDKVLYGNPLLPEGTGIYQLSGLPTAAAWTKLYEFGGSKSPQAASAVLVTEGTHTNRTIWLYNSDITPPWERQAGSSENVWTGADAVTAPTFDGTLSSDDVSLSKALLTLDKYFKALQIREHPTIKTRVILTASEVLKTDDTTLDTLINGKLMRFLGAQIDFASGTIYEANGVTVRSTFAAPSVPDNEYFWYGVALELAAAGSNNMINPVIRVNLASASNLVKDSAPRPSFDEDYVLGSVWVQGAPGAPLINDIYQTNVVQIGEINLAALISRIEALEATVSLHTTEINELQSACGAILANTPKRQVFDTPIGGATIYTLNPLIFSVEFDNARMDIDVFIDGRWQPQSILGDFSDGAYRKNSTTILEFAETVLDEQEVIVMKRDAGGIFANAVKIQRFPAVFGGQNIFTLDPLIFTVINDNTVLDVDYYINGRWQKQTTSGDFEDPDPDKAGAVKKNSLLEIETADTVPAGQEFTVVRRTPNGMSSGGGGPATDLENITVDLGFVIPKSVGTLTNPASSLILKDTANSDIWQLKVTSGALLCIKIS